MSKSKTNPPYPEAFRAEAVALVRTSGKSIPVLARGRRAARRNDATATDQPAPDKRTGRAPARSTQQRKKTA